MASSKKAIAKAESLRGFEYLPLSAELQSALNEMDSCMRAFFESTSPEFKNTCKPTSIGDMGFQLTRNVKEAFQIRIDRSRMPWPDFGRSESAAALATAFGVSGRGVTAAELNDRFRALGTRLFRLMDDAARGCLRTLLQTASLTDSEQ